MVTKEETKVIDPEFAFVGPMGFDLGAFQFDPLIHPQFNAGLMMIGLLVANFLLSYFSQPPGRAKYQQWLLAQVASIWNVRRSDC
jgi:5-methylthioribose kinase